MRHNKTQTEQLFGLNLELCLYVCISFVAFQIRTSREYVTLSWLVGHLKIIRGNLSLLQ